MLYGLSSYALGWRIRHDPGYRPIDLVRDAHALRLDSVQICVNLPVTRLSTQDLQALREEAEQRQITLQLGLRGLTREAVLEWLDCCTVLGSHLLRAVIDAQDYEPDLAAVGELISSLLPEFEARQVTLGIENHDRFQAAELAAMIRNVPSPLVRVCLDTANSLGADEGLREVVGHLGPLTVNLHVKEFTTKRLPHGYGFVVEGAPLGQGMVDWAWLLKQLPDLQSLSLEQWAPEQPSPEATTRLERQWLEQGVPVLRSWAAQNQNVTI